MTFKVSAATPASYNVIDLHSWSRSSRESINHSSSVGPPVGSEYNATVHEDVMSFLDVTRFHMLAPENLQKMDFFPESP
ncbi:hypothetical protein X801_07910, partial [Opisthorchis viverrini]